MKTTFQCKPDFQFRDFVIEKTIRLSAEQFMKMLGKPLAEQHFLAENAALMRQDEKGVYHCLLVTGEGRLDGLLVQSEGSRYARYASYVPDAIALQYPPLSQMNRNLASAVDFIIAEGTGQADNGSWTLSFAELQERTGIDVLGEGFLQQLLGDMLRDRPEVACLTIADGRFVLAFCPNCQQAERSPRSPEMNL